MTALVFDAVKHEYRLEGRRLPHVTQVTGYLQDFYGIPEKILERKRDLGTALHLVTQLYDEDDLDETSVPEVVGPYFEAYRKFRTDTGFAPLAIEARVVSRTYGYAGTLDRVGRFAKLKRVKPHEDCTVDLKATYTLAPAVGPQTALYTQAWNEQHGAKVKRRFALQLKPDATYRLHECTDAYDLSVALAALSLINWKARHTEGASH